MIFSCAEILNLDHNDTSSGAGVTRAPHGKHDARRRRLLPSRRPTGATIELEPRARAASAAASVSCHT